MAKQLDDGHWLAESFKQRMPAKQWREILLAGNDRILVSGELRQLIAKRLGLGVVEVSKQPIDKARGGKVGAP